MNYLLWVSFLSLFIYGFGDNIRGPLFPEIIKTFQLSDSSAAWYFALPSLMSFVGSFLVRKVKKVSSLLILVYIGLSCIFVGFAIQHFANQYFVILIGAAFFGLSIGFLGMAQNNLVILGTTKKNRPRMLSFLHSMYGMASLLAPLYVAWLSDFEWQQIIFYFSWTALGLSLIGFILHFRKMDRIQHFSQFQEAAHSGFTKLSELKISLAISFYVLAEVMVSTRLALFMRRNFDLDLKSSSLYVTLFFGTLLSGRLLVSYSTFNLSTRNWLLGSLVGTFIFILLGLFVHPIGFVLCGFTMGPFYPLSMSYISDLFPLKSTTIVSWTLAVQSIFIVSMHWGIGRLTDLLDLRWAMVCGPLFLLLSFLILIFIREENHA